MMPRLIVTSVDRILKSKWPNLKPSFLLDNESRHAGANRYVQCIKIHVHYKGKKMTRRMFPTREKEGDDL